MNTETPMLTKLMLDSGAPVEVMDQLWFHIFCASFADNIIKMIEGEVSE